MTRRSMPVPSLNVRASAVLVAGLVASSAGCHRAGGSVPRTETRPSGTFEEVEVRGAVDVSITVGSAPSVRIQCDDDAVGTIRTETVGSVLVIDTDHDGPLDVRAGTPCSVQVTMPKLVALSLSGSGDATVNGAAEGLRRVAVSGSADATLERVRGDLLEVGVSGSGNVRVADLAAKSVSVAVSGSGDVDLRGEAEGLRVHASGSGNLDARTLAAREAEVEVTGSSDVAVRVAKRVQVRVSGSGDVTIVGHPEQESVRTSGSGEVTFE